MKKILILLLACSAGIQSQAQAPEATDTPETTATQSLVFPEPEFVGQALAIRPGDKTEQLVQESLNPATVHPPARNYSASERTISTK